RTVEKQPQEVSAKKAAIISKPVIMPKTKVIVPTSGKMTITSEPEGATVFIGGSEKGITPLDLPDQAFGSYDIKVSLKGYNDAQQTDQLNQQNATVEAPISLEPAA